MSWGLELWDRVDAVIGQITEDTDELATVFTRWVISVGDEFCLAFDQNWRVSLHGVKSCAGL